MMDFISIPATVGIVTYGVYKILELGIKKSERMKMIDKVSDINNVTLQNPDVFSQPSGGQFTALRFGMVMLGIGLGILVGYLIVISGVGFIQDKWLKAQMIGAAIGASTLLFGGLALVISFIIENKIRNKYK